MAIFRKPRHTPSREIGLYIHIPFCAEKCMYCDFYSLPCGGMGDADMARLTDDYCDAVMLQLEDQAGIAGQCVVDSVYLGGGTPTMLSSRQLVDMLDCVCDNYKVASDAEITVEANPGTVEKFGKKGLMGLRRAGVSRVSMGMQSGDDAELRALGRIHRAEDVRSSVESLREAGIENISLDLMYGIPLQTRDSLFDSIDAAAALEPKHISLYGLTIEPGTPFDTVKDKLDLPGDDEMADMYLAAVEYLRRLGYRQYEISNFALPGWACRHNLRYWRGGEYLGFGPAAASFFDRRRTRIGRHLDAYIDAMRADGNLAPLCDEDELISGEDERSEYIMLHLRLVEGVSDAEYLSRYGEDFGERYQVSLLRMLSGGYITHENGRWVLTPQGMYVSNYILSDLLAVDGR